jgi:outer membrane protein
MKANTLLLTILCLLGAASLQAQELKIGYTNADYILSQMPEAKQIESELKTHQEQLAAQLQSKQEEFQRKYDYFNKTAETMTEVVRNDAQRELQAMQANLQKFASEADQSIKNKQVQLLSPVYEKIDSTIKEVAAENGFSHVFSNGALLYASAENDISNLVLAKMGIPVDQQ